MLTARVVDDRVYGLTLLAFQVNGDSLVDLVTAAGAPDQGWMYPPVWLVDGEHFFGGEDEWEHDSFEDGRVPILSCGCSFPGCDAVVVHITRMPGAVAWSDFEVYRAEKALAIGPFTFDAVEYEQALRRR